MTREYQAQALTIEIYCPVQKTNASIPIHDCVRFLWDKKAIQVYCVACKENHTISLKHLRN